MRSLIAIFAAHLLVGSLVLFAQDEPTKPEPKPPLVALMESIDTARSEMLAARAELDAAASPEARVQLAEVHAEAEKRLRGLETSFKTIATGVDVAQFDLRERKQIDIGQEFQEALQPIVEEFKNATERLRAIEDLRSDIEYQTRRRATARTALENLDEATTAAKEPKLIATLKTMRTRWQANEEDAGNQLGALQYRLDESLNDKKSVLDTITEGFKRFFGSRGKNLLATLLTFIAVMLVLRWLGRRLRRFSPWHKPGKRSFYSRLVDVLWFGFTFVGAMVAAILVLYTSGDWVLLGLAVLFIFGLALAAKGALPRFYEQARLLLNLGEVREAERVVIGGIPWRVESLGVFTDLENPLLDGGALRLPIRNLVDLRSRPYDEKEPWFPCATGEWVLLSDGTRGKVTQQTPEMVHLVLLGGSRKSYLTADFLAAAPEVLSRNFRARSIFGVDYGLQGIVTSEVPEILQAAVTRELLGIVERDQIQRVKVEFREAGSSSLNLEIIADMKGEVASKYEVIQRALQKAAVDACNENGWTIPFPQLTLHRGAPAKVPVVDEED